MGRKKKHTHTIPKHINKKEKEKEPLTLIRVIRNNKNPQRERESTHTFVWKKYGLD